MQRLFCLHYCCAFFPNKMSTFRNNKKVAVVSRETHEEHPRNGQFQELTSNISHRFQEIEDRVTKKLSQEFSRTESLILVALSKSDEFLMNPQIRTLSGTVPGSSRNAGVKNREPTGDHYQNDPHPEVESSVYQYLNSIDLVPEEASCKVIQRIFAEW